MKITIGEKDFKSYAGKRLVLMRPAKNQVLGFQYVPETNVVKYGEIEYTDDDYKTQKSFVRKDLDLDTAIDTINHALNNGAYLEKVMDVPILKGWHTKVPIRWSASKKRAAPKKRVPAVRVNVRKMF